MKDNSEICCLILSTAKNTLISLNFLVKRHSFRKCEKMLGIKIDHKLSFDKHVKIAWSSKVNNTLRTLFFERTI